jgi:RNA polymerase sigma-70 factor, ECF subfamily
MNLSDNSPASAAPSLSLTTLSSLAGVQDKSLPRTDDALVSLTRGGDVAAFRELLGRHEEHLLRLALRFVRNEQDAQEVLQDVFVATWRKLPGFEERAQIGSWLYRVTVNAALMHLRMRKRRPKLVDFPAADASADVALSEQDLAPNRGFRPDELLESRELGRVIQAAVEKLPSSLKSVFQVREVQGWSTRQTAKLLGLSEATVKTRLHRARLVLRQEVERYLLQ